MEETPENAASKCKFIKMAVKKKKYRSKIEKKRCRGIRIGKTSSSQISEKKKKNNFRVLLSFRGNLIPVDRILTKGVILKKFSELSFRKKVQEKKGGGIWFVSFRMP